MHLFANFIRLLHLWLCAVSLCSFFLLLLTSNSCPSFLLLLTGEKLCLHVNQPLVCACFTFLAFFSLKRVGLSCLWRRCILRALGVLWSTILLARIRDGGRVNYCGVCVECFNDSFARSSRLAVVYLLLWRATLSCYRCTPFGLGFTLLLQAFTDSGATKLVWCTSLSPALAVKRRTREGSGLDVGLLMDIISNLE